MKHEGTTEGVIKHKNLTPQNIPKTKYYDCIGTEVKVGDSVVFAEDDSMELSVGEIIKLPLNITCKAMVNHVFEIEHRGLIFRRFREEIYYITTLDELGE